MLQEYTFGWNGQIAGFSVEGTFRFNEHRVGEDGIVSTDELFDLDVTFRAPDGALLETYEDNHKDEGVNFNFDVESGEILQDGVFDAPDGINIGDGTRSDGLTFWSKPFEQAIPHVHVDDWQDEFGFPLGFSSHEDVGFFSLTTQQLVDSGAVGDAYITEIEGDEARLQETGERIEATPKPEPETGFTPVFNSIDGDVIDVDGSGNLVFAGGGDDFVDASASSEGGNRIFLAGGDDIAVLGQDDTYNGGSGDDQFFAVEGGANILTGGRGADQFWITTGDFIGISVEATASDAYYTFAGNVSGNSDIRLLSDKATAIGFEGFDTNSFLKFEAPADAPATGDPDAELIAATLRLEHDQALTAVANLLPATEERPVNVSAYGFNAGATFDPVEGNDEDIDFGEGGENANSTVSVGANGIYEWDVTDIVNNEDGRVSIDIALSGVFGNEDTDSRNSYAAFYSAFAEDGLEPTLVMDFSAVNTITDFVSGEDVIGIAGFDIEFDDLELSQDVDDTIIGIEGRNLARVADTDLADWSADDFFIA